MKDKGKINPELNEDSIVLEPKPKEICIYDGTVSDKVNIDSLWEFEAASWPEEEMASRDDLEHRLLSFPEGIAMLFSTDEQDNMLKPMAQFTMLPKTLPENIEGFEQMRDIEINLESDTLWGVNISRRRGKEYSNKGYASELVEERLKWAKESGYRRFLGGVTCDGLKEFIEDYLENHREDALKEIAHTGNTSLPKLREQALNQYFEHNYNPATKLFERVANNLGLQITIGEPINDYWPINETSLGYGVMVEILLNKTEIVESDKNQELEFSFDLDKPQLLGLEERMTIDGNENTMFCYLPAKGCPNNCEFCSVKHIKAENFAPSIEQSIIASEKIRKYLNQHPETDTVKIFNAGNILHGTEFGERCEVNDYFWEKLPEVLAELKEQGSALGAVEIEVRLDELDPESSAPNKELISERLLDVSKNLNDLGIELRVLLALEYIDQEVIERQGKFPKSQEYKQSVNRVFNWLGEHHITTLAYAMFGGRIADRPMNGDEATMAAFNTIDFALSQTNPPREVIVNWQYLDPIQQEREKKEGKQLYMPTETDARNLLLLLWRKLATNKNRVRISYQPEDTIVGTKGAELTKEFRTILDSFNSAANQQEFLTRYFA